MLVIYSSFHSTSLIIYTLLLAKSLLSRFLPWHSQDVVINVSFSQVVRCVLALVSKTDPALAEQKQKLVAQLPDDSEE